MVAGVIGSRPVFLSGTGSSPADETESVSPNSCCSGGVSFPSSFSSSCSILRALPELVVKDEALEVAFREPAATATGGLVAAVVVVVSFAASAAFLLLVVGGVVKGVFGGFIGKLVNVSSSGRQERSKKVSLDSISRPPLFNSFFFYPPRSTQISQPTNLVSQWNIKEEKKNECNKQLRKRERKCL